MTTRDYSAINLNAPGRVDILAPGDVNELVFAGWPVSASGKLSRDVRLVLQIDKVSFTVEAAVTVSKASTDDNTSLSDLLSDLDAAMRTASWQVVQSDGPPATPAIGSAYTQFSADANAPDIKAKLRDGHIRLASPYEIKVLATKSTDSNFASLNVQDLGVVFGNSTALSSGAVMPWMRRVLAQPSPSAARKARTASCTLPAKSVRIQRST